MKIIALILVVASTGCASVVKHLPSSPVRLGGGEVDILYGTLRFGGYLEVGNPFRARGGTNESLSTDGK